MSKKKQTLKVIPLGGVAEIGKNITVFETKNDIIIVDCGLAFPEDYMLGVDVVIADTTYLQERAHKVRGIVITHGHEDHIGGIPYILRNLKVPIYCPRLVLTLLEIKLTEHRLLSQTELHLVHPEKSVTLGDFEIEFIHSNHSIPDVYALAIHTPVGTVVHTSDFKIDHTPIDGVPIDLQKFAKIGSKGVLLMLGDSTNAERPGYTMSESVVGKTLEDLFRKSDHRVIVSTFASNIHRIQQIIDAAESVDRKVAVSGRSMFDTVEIAMELGYVKVKPGTICHLDEIERLPRNRQTLITTGTQGEPMSALTRISSGNHRQITIQKDDMVIISASPIPGNEKQIFRVINDLFHRGAQVIYQSLADIHVSGHACREELKIMHALVKPKYFIPVHGEYRQMKQHANLAKSMGMSEESIFVLHNGSCVEFSKDGVVTLPDVTSGNILVDGLGVGDVGNIVLRDRKHLSQDGLMVIVITVEKQSGKIFGEPDITSRGFIYVKEAEALLEESKNKVISILKKRNMVIQDTETIKSSIKQDMSAFLYHKTKRRPMILPVVVEI